MFQTIHIFFNIIIFMIFIISFLSFMKIVQERKGAKSPEERDAILEREWEKDKIAPLWVMLLSFAWTVAVVFSAIF